MNPSADLDRKQSLVFEELKRIAAAGEKCPSNVHLASKLPIGAATKASQIMSALAAKGLIQVISSGSARVVVITETGHRTAGTITQSRPKTNFKVSDDELREMEPVYREPCFACGVPFDRHQDHGCKRWRSR
jgi:hypothetical protein